MKVLGLDIATRTGFALLEDSVLTKFGWIKLERINTYRERFRSFRKGLLEVLESVRPDIVVIEETYVGRNVKTTAYLNMLRGICIESVPDVVKLFTSHVSSMRAEILGRGCKHDKKEVYSYCVSRFKLKSFTYKGHNDITDAILLALWGLEEAKRYDQILAKREEEGRKWRKGKLRFRKVLPPIA